ncbi:hypothetical protein F3K37_42025 [Streptomyces sp. LBUM 1477]|nr:hypothetical protein [Streptomyces sp. LBUM 1477]MBP5880687.1 hypothetical protein [Streptomyces sp. LBUM 1477]
MPGAAPGRRRVRVRWLERPAWAAFPVARRGLRVDGARARCGTARARPTRSERIVVRAGDLPDAGLLDLAYV